jgi:hypothetical protein
MATVTAADAGASSSNQKLAANAATTATQMRTPNAQALSGAPAKLNGRGMVAVVMGSSRALQMSRLRRKPPRWPWTCD